MMKQTIKYSLQWNNINRRIYKGMYEALRNESHLKQYYSCLHKAISSRGKYCPHYKKS